MIFDVWMCLYEIDDGSLNKRVTVMKRVAVPRCPLDPIMRPYGAIDRIGTYDAADADEAIAQSHSKDRAPRPRNKIRRP